VKISEAQFIKLLPNSVSGDRKFQAAASAIDQQFARVADEIRLSRIWSRIDELEEPILSNLAMQVHLEAYEGWALAETVEHSLKSYPVSIEWKLLFQHSAMT
jgi:hypothetical protein